MKAPQCVEGDWHDLYDEKEKSSFVNLEHKRD